MAESAGRLRALLGRGSIRLRTTLLASAVVGVALLVAAGIFVTVVERTLTDDVVDDLRARADEITRAAHGGASDAALVATDNEDEVVQILGPDGAVRAATARLGDAPPLAELSSGGWRRVDVPFDDEPFVVLAARLPDGEPGAVLVGRTLEHAADTTRLVAVMLAVGLPLVLLVVATTTWRVVGRALRPVERVRREVEAISAADLHRRVEPPAAGDEIALLARTMNGMLDRLERSQQRQRQLVSDTSHELRSPIASIRQAAEVATEHPQVTTVERLAAATLADAIRMQGMVDDLLLLAAADEGRLRAAGRAVDLDDIVLAEAPADARFDLSGVSGARTLGDPAALTRAVRNLVDNAARHAIDRVAISTYEEAGHAWLVVDDDGAGVPPAERQRVFERFVRLDEARARDDGGSGLGLAIVAEVARAHGGSVELTSSPLGGARVAMRLPVADDGAGSFSVASGSGC